MLKSQTGILTGDLDNSIFVLCLMIKVLFFIEVMIFKKNIFKIIKKIYDKKITFVTISSCVVVEPLL